MPVDGKLERVKGIEPSYSAWEAAALPLSYTRKRLTAASASGQGRIRTMYGWRMSIKPFCCANGQAWINHGKTPHEMPLPSAQPLAKARPCQLGMPL